MRQPNGKIYVRRRLFGAKDGPKYMSSTGGGIRLYFPLSQDRGSVVRFLAKNPESPLYIAEGEKKAAKAWREGIPCIGISGIWCWLANKDDRPNRDMKLNPDFELIPYLDQREIVMVYDSDANDPDKKNEFQRCSKTFQRSLLKRGINRYNDIILPSDGRRKVGLDDFLMDNKVSDFERIVAEQSTTVSLDSYIMTSEEFMSAEFPPINFIIEPWLSDCGLTMVHSAPGVGKTFFLLGMAGAITRENLPADYCGWKIKNGAGVLIVDGEMPSIIMQKRLALVEAAFPDNQESKDNKLSILSCSHYSRQTHRAINFSDESCRDWFTNAIIEHPAKVIVFDNVVSLTSMKDENDAGSWSDINKWLLYLRSLGKAVIIVHHSSKHGKQRGTSHRADNLDTIIKLEKNGQDGIEIVFEKHRNFGGTQAAPVYVDFEINESKAIFKRSKSLYEQRQERDKEIMEMLESGKTRQEVAEHFGVDPSRISQIKTKMEAQDKE